MYICPPEKSGSFLIFAWRKRRYFCVCLFEIEEPFFHGHVNSTVFHYLPAIEGVLIIHQSYDTLSYQNQLKTMKSKKKRKSVFCHVGLVV